MWDLEQYVDETIVAKYRKSFARVSNLYLFAAFSALEQYRLYCSISMLETKSILAAIVFELQSSISKPLSVIITGLYLLGKSHRIGFPAAK